eukprot:s223_g52.t3
MHLAWSDFAVHCFRAPTVACPKGALIFSPEPQFADLGQSHDAFFPPFPLNEGERNGRNFRAQRIAPPRRMMIGLGHALLAVVLNFIWLDARWGVTTLVLALFHQLGLSRHNPRGFNVARFTALLLNGVLVVVVGVVVLTLATLGVDSDYSAFCIEGTPGCKYYEVPMFVTNSSSPVECGQNYPYGSRGQKALSISDFALFSSLAYESEEGLVRGLKRYHPGWRLTFSRRAGIGDPEASLDCWSTFLTLHFARRTHRIGHGGREH